MRPAVAGLLALVLLSGCAPSGPVPPGSSGTPAVRRLDPGDFPEFRDDLHRSSLIAAINRSLDYLDRVPADHRFPLGGLRPSRARLAESLVLFRDYLEGKVARGVPLESFLRREFDVYEAPGPGAGSRGLLTGYFEPVLAGSRVRQGAFQYPLYRTPGDLVRVDLGRFRPDLAGDVLAGRVEKGELVPYYTREQIDQQGVLAGRGLELLWLDDPVDRFFLQVQGAGQIVFPDGSRIRVGYAAANGRPYRSIGRLLIEEGKIPRREMSLTVLEQYLHRHPEEQARILSYNKSYIFFRVVKEGPLGSLEEVLTPGRSIATDLRYYPAGALAYLIGEKPDRSAEGGEISRKPLERFVLNQDSGGAIRGAGRVDLFWGSGAAAGRLAGALRDRSRLFFLLRKDPRRRNRSAPGPGAG